MKHQAEIQPPDNARKYVMLLVVAAMIAAGVIHSLSSCNTDKRWERRIDKIERKCDNSHTYMQQYIEGKLSKEELDELLKSQH